MKAALTLVPPLLLVAVLLGVTFAVPSIGQQQAPPGTDDDAARSVAAFRTVARVLRHPRCLNCHPSGDVPRVGDDRQLHLMNVQRGTAGLGPAGLKCTACHQPANQDLIGVPGAPHWLLAPRSMGWEGLDDHELAEQLEDPARNGGRSLGQLLHHVSEDPLVLWGWQPDAGRAPVPIPHQEFVEAFRTWIETGAVSPVPGTTTY